MTGKLERQERTGMTVTAVVTEGFASVPHEHDRVTLSVAPIGNEMLTRSATDFGDFYYFCSINTH